MLKIPTSKGDKCKKAGSLRLPWIKLMTELGTSDRFRDLCGAEAKPPVLY
jgi:hypothetical protein